MAGKNLYNKVFDQHTVTSLGENQYQLFIGLHLIHEVTSPQAFAILNEKGLKVPYPKRTFATVDHIIPTEAKQRQRPLADAMAEEMLQAIEANTAKHGIPFFSPSTDYQGIVHVVGPELGITQPGMTIACGDSHTSTHGAFGSLAFGIGTSQIADILASQTMRVEKLKVRRIQVDGILPPGVYAKDVILKIINQLTVKGGVGYAYEYAGSAIEAMSMEERMTLCNMSIEGGAKIGYVNPDQKTYEYLKGRMYSPTGAEWDHRMAYWESIRSDVDAHYDDVLTIDASKLKPFVTWGITPGQSIMIDETLPPVDAFGPSEKALLEQAYEYMSFQPGQKILGTPIDVVFVGSCTNGRLSDFQEVARLVKGKKVNPRVRALAVPGSIQVKKEVEKLGLHIILQEAGFEWREAGCSMCLAMNPDQLKGREISASTSNRNFKGRQGSPTGRTLLVSPAMAAAAAITGELRDCRELFADELQTTSST